MNRFKMRLKRKPFQKIVQTEEDANAYIQPFQQMPCVGHVPQESVDRIDAHDLFSHYTVEIIKKDIVYGR